jgi:hypothetical protein
MGWMVRIASGILNMCSPSVLRVLATSRLGSWFLRTWSLLTVKLQRLDSRVVPPDQDELRLFLCVRNERAILPYFFDYYRKLGVSRFFVVDNDSSDGTREFVLSQSDAHLFATSGSYAQAQYGLVWIRHLLYRYGCRRWCILADADELLIYPQMDRVTLPELCRRLDARRFEGLECMLLDMYSDRPIKDAIYTPGQNPLDICPFFDPASHYPRHFYDCQAPFGGVRQRMFGTEVCLRKVPLVKVTPYTYVHLGYHEVWTVRLAEMRGVMLHFKFFSRFCAAAKEEAYRGEHWNGASEYKKYLDVLQDQQELNLAYEGSVRYSGAEQLLRLNLIKETPDWRAYAVGRGDAGVGNPRA